MYSFLKKINNDFSIIPNDYLKNNKMNNILYLLNHKTLTDFDIPILINKGYGVLLSKKYDNLDSITHSVYNNNNNYYYDNFVNVSYSDINKLNNIDWYDNNTITQEIINILNNHFKYIIITLLISSKLINQLIEQYNGIIVFRFFGLQKNGRYKSLLNDRNILISKENINNKIKFLFSYPEIYEFEKSFDNYFNDKNSYITRLGLSNNLINKIINTYTPINNTICFVHSKINYYPCCTQIYNEFVNNFKNYDYLLLGRNNFIEDKYKLDNVDDETYYKKIAECKLMYYHCKDERLLHYHPLEGIVIGIPVIFHKESLLSSYLPNSLGRCEDIEDAKKKINRILNHDIYFMMDIINEQNKIIDTLTIDYNKNNFDELLSIV